MENLPRENTNYHDGENVTHYLGNDDYPGQNLGEYPEKDLPKRLTGKEALGNEVKDTEQELSETLPEVEDLDYE